MIYHYFANDIAGILVQLKTTLVVTIMAQLVPEHQLLLRQFTFYFSNIRFGWLPFRSDHL